jgi:tripartite-type tricarboxylate transporter receptor subunit TctC
VLAALAACALAAPAAAQTWPARPVRIIVPYSPGGGIDTVARVMAQKLAEHTGSTFVVENRPGAGGVIGSELVARAAPDGYTLLASASEFGVNPAVRSRLPYDPFKDFAPISQIAAVQYILAGHPSVPVTNVKELIAFAKTRPGQLTYGSSGTGGGPHFAGEMFQLLAGIRWLHVPFKGAQPATTALISGEIGFLFASNIALLNHVRSGRTRALAVTGQKRYVELPQVPTVVESGLPGYTAPAFYGFYAPGGTSPELVRRIYTEATRALGSPDVKERLARTGNDYLMSSPEEFAAFIRNEIATWTKVARQANIQVE